MFRSPVPLVQGVIPIPECHLVVRSPEDLVGMDPSQQNKMSPATLLLM